MARASGRWIIAAGVVAVTGFVLFIVGISLMVKANNQECEETGRDSEERTDTGAGGRCDTSEEAKTTGFADFLTKLQTTYYDVQPYELIYRPGGVKPAELKAKLRPYDPSPENLKEITLTAQRLLEELDNLKVNVDKLKMREKKAMAQVKHFLKHVFGTPYDGNYFAGDFLMGPNLFCWQPICLFGSYVSYNLRYFKPSTVDDVKFLRDKFKEVKASLAQYVENMRYGVRAGMVRSVEECVAGLNAIKRRSLEVSLKGDIGIYEESYMNPIFDPVFLSSMKSSEEKKWQDENGGKTVNASIREFALEYLGKPINELFTFLATENMQHCVPSNVSSGLASLPLDYVYVNGSRTNEKTTKKLPTGEALDGKKAYALIMPYFTTVDISPDDVHKLGFEMLNKLYPEVLEIARTEMKQSNNDTAKDLFIQRLDEPDMYFTGGDAIPKNESNEAAYTKCVSEETARMFCPTRWAAMQRWFNEARRVMSLLEPKTVDMFYFTGPKHTAPNCPVEMRPRFNPSSGAQSYTRSNSQCTRNAFYNIPFFLEKPGPKFEEWSVNAHEARPGHHTQIQGIYEHFTDNCGGVINWLGSITSYTAFTEGWALYAENPLIARDTDTYKDNLLQKYGMLKWQVWRALRLIVDTGLHYKGFSRQKALDFFADYAWDTSDGAEKEVTRYQSDPGQATAYMIGQLRIMKLRDYAKEKLGEKFNLKDFHFYLLAQGWAPLAYIEDSIHKYVSCALDDGGEGCADVLDPTGGGKKAALVFNGVIGDTEYEPPEKLPPEDYM